MKKTKTPLLMMLTLMFAAIAIVQGCGSPSADSWMDPSAVGRFESAPDSADKVVSAEALHSLSLSESAVTKGPIALTKPGDDIWIIVKPPKQTEPRDPKANNDDDPGAGALVAIIPPTQDPEAKPTLVPMPLKHTDVKASVAGYIATVDVTQQYHNPFDSKIEAVYQFPLPQDAAVSEFVMEVGPEDDRRRIRGIIREKEEAQRLYNAARAQGLNASLLSQVRPNIFEQKVANIEPGKQIDIKIRYFNTLSYHDGWYSFAFPMTIGPRFNPPNSADPVHAAARGTAPKPDGTTITYLRPNERSGHDIALSLQIDAGVSIEEAKCLTHTVASENPGEDPNKLSVKLAKDDAIPNKDFVFAFRVVGESMKSGLVTHVDENGKGYFTLMMYPPAELKQLDRQPMEMIFVVDTSGSMNGEPMRQAKDAMRHALTQLKPGDSFQIIQFNNQASAFGPNPVPVNRANIRRGLDYVNSLTGRGGTMAVEGVRAALSFPHDKERHRVVTFMTDGLIGNERQIIREMNRLIGDARVFSFGVGSSVNRYLMERMAKVGRGAAAYLLPGTSGEEVMDLYFKRISHPAMTDVQISWGGAEVAQVYPARTPDLLVGRPVILTGRYKGKFDQIHISGKAAGEPVKLAVSGEGASQHEALGRVWARRKIADLMDRMAIEGEDEYKPVILATALEYNLVSRYTSFLAVDTSRKTAGDSGTTVHQPIPVPEGVKYQNTVEDKD